jgi:membrane-associated phospholipid phosphatase
VNRAPLFWLISALFLLAGGIQLLFFQPEMATVFANSHHTPWLDWFFKYYTQIAEWPVIVLALVLALLKHPITGFWAGITYGIEALLINGLKLWFREPRPRVQLGIENMHQIDGVAILSGLSFPSGHTAAAFIGFGLISFMHPSKWIQVFAALGAILVGYSRMYLGQHYLRDVLGGEAIALLLLALYALNYHRLHPVKLHSNHAV